ncbi:DNA topoisomerase III [Myxococcota bacterium]|nr:DNA topoisomerase III [Myxococcota bacterium]
MTRLVIAEKPSVARDLARVLGATQKHKGYIEGNGWLVTWCVGHLVQLCEPHEYDPSWKRWSMQVLPMLPARFQLRANEQTRDQFDVVERLLKRKDVRSVVNACDAGREGELIFRYVAQLAGYQGPIERLWISSMTDEAIQQGFARLRQGAQLDPLWDAARCRSEADWLVGLNATRAMTLRVRSAVPQGTQAPLFSVGRVQTPTLALIVEREKEIVHFVPQDYWQIEADFQANAGNYRGRWFRLQKQEGEQEPQQIDRFDKEQDALDVIARIEGQQGTIAKVERKQVKEPPPLLFDLNRLQRTANKRYGFSAARTLEIAQSLYEKHKVITYPRTDSMFLSKDMQGEMNKTMKALDQAPYDPFIQFLRTQGKLPMPKRVFNDAKVSDHHAIIPTTRKANLAQLTPDERKIYDLVVRRFLGAFFPDAVFEKTRVITEIAGELFLTRGKVVVNSGWREVAGFQDDVGGKPQKKGKEDESEDPQDKDEDEQGILPPLKKGEMVALLAAELLKKKTQPPPRYTEASLLAAMEGAGKLLEDEELQQALKDSGLGTPATRASIIETLLSRNYILRKGKSLCPSETGMQLIDAIPAQSLRSPQLTGQWEAFLSRIARGEERAEDFDQKVRAYVQRLIEGIRQAPIQRLAVAGAQASATNSPESASDDKASSMAPKNGDPKAPKAKSSKSPKASDPKAQKNHATLQTTPQHEESLEDADVSEPSNDDMLCACPSCGGKIKVFPKVFACIGKPPEMGCGFRVFAEIKGKKLSNAMVRELITKRKTRVLKGFVSKTQQPFEARLILDDQLQVKFDFSDIQHSTKAPSPPPSIQTAQSSQTAKTTQTQSSVKSSPSTGALPSAKKTRKASSKDTVLPPPKGALIADILQTKRTTADPSNHADASPPSTSVSTKTIADVVRDTPPKQPTQGHNEALGACPRCHQGSLISGRQAWGCSRWREGCHTMIPYTVEGSQIAPSEAKKLLARGSVRPLEPFRGPQGPFLGEIRLTLDQGDSIVSVVPAKVPA